MTTRFSIVRRRVILGLLTAVLAATVTPALSQPKPAPKPTPLPPVLVAPGVSLPIVPVSAKGKIGVDEQLWGASDDRPALLSAIDHSLRYLQTPASARAYQAYPVSGVTRDRVRRSLERFRQLVLTSRSAPELQAAVEREFTLYQAVGRDRRGTVQFTAYYEPVHPASRVRTDEFRYPLFRVPPTLSRWQQPHPTRSQLEGKDGLQYEKGRLKGLELVWLRDRLDAYLVQVQGSAQLQLTDGTTMTVGYAGRTNYPYVSLGKELIAAGKFKAEKLTMPVMLDYFRQNPKELDAFLTRNQRFVFFQETNGAQATGSLNVPVTAERSIATDKALFPPGALTLIQTRIPIVTPTGLEMRPVSRYALDQDTGGAIKGTGRVDYFMGTGPQAGDRAGGVNSTGQLYYLLLKS